MYDCNIYKLYTDNCDEPNLDVQYLMGVSQVSPTTYWYVSTSQDAYVEFCLQVAEQSSPPLVNSISYGMVEQVRTTCAVIASVYGVMV